MATGQGTPAKEPKTCAGCGVVLSGQASKWCSRKCLIQARVRAQVLKAGGPFACRCCGARVIWRPQGRYCEKEACREYGRKLRYGRQIETRRERDAKYGRPGRGGRPLRGDDAIVAADEALEELRASMAREREAARRRGTLNARRASSLAQAEAWERGDGARLAELRENGLTGKAGAVSRGSKNVEG